MWPEVSRALHRCRQPGNLYLVVGPLDGSIPASSLDSSFRVQGKYVQFDVDAATLGIRNCAFLPTRNALDMTGGVETPVYASKTPNHCGLTLTSALLIELKDDARPSSAAART